MIYFYANNAFEMERSLTKWAIFSYITWIVDLCIDRNKSSACDFFLLKKSKVIFTLPGRSMNRLRTNALQNVQQHGCQPEIN